MNNEEAKFLLQAYRPSGHDASDPAFAPALEQAKNDPALARWFAREQAHASAVAAKLRAVQPPAGLREAILAGGRATEQIAASGSRRAWPQWLAIAASIAILVAVGVTTSLRRAASPDALTAFAIDDVVHGRHGGHGEAAKALQVHLSAPEAKLAAGLPMDFATLQKTGCRTLRVAGHDVLEVCFVRNGSEFHCYIGRVGDFRSPTNRDGSEFVQREGLAAATWASGAYRYVVVSDAGLDAVKRLL